MTLQKITKTALLVGIMMASSPAYAQEAKGFLSGSLMAINKEGDLKARVGTLYKSNGKAEAHTDAKTNIVLLNDGKRLDFNMGTLDKAKGDAFAVLNNSSVKVDNMGDGSTSIDIATIKTPKKFTMLDDVAAAAQLTNSAINIRNREKQASLKIANIERSEQFGAPHLSSFKNVKAEANLDGASVTMNNGGDVEIAHVKGNSLENVSARANLTGDILVNKKSAAKDASIHVATIEGDKIKASKAEANINGHLIVDGAGHIFASTIHGASGAKTRADVNGGVRVTKGGVVELGTIQTSDARPLLK